MPITLEHVSYTYAPGTPFAADALQDVSLTVADGAFVGVMGRTGCGKSTLLQLIAGLLCPTSGRVLVDGADINAHSYDRTVLRSRLAVVFQFPEYQLFETTVERDVAFGLRHSGLSADEITARVRWALEKTGFSYESIRTQSPLALSGGEKRRVAIAGALAARPAILVFDEPIAGLDPLGRESFLALVTGLNAEGTTILMVSHNADCIAEYAQRVLVFDGGRLVLDGPPETVFSDAARAERLHIGLSGARHAAGLLHQAGIPVSGTTVRYAELLAGLTAALSGRCDAGAKAKTPACAKDGDGA